MPTDQAAQPAAPPQAPELPRAYQRDVLTLLVRDPNWIFAFWEVTSGTLSGARAALGEDARLILRVHDLGPARFDPPSPLQPDARVGSFDLSLGDTVGDWHISVRNAGHAYRASVGLHSGQAFWSLLDSNTVATPTGRVADEGDSTWMTLEPLYRYAWVSDAAQLRGAVRLHRAARFIPAFEQRRNVRPILITFGGKALDSSTNSCAQAGTARLRLHRLARPLALHPPPARRARPRVGLAARSDHRDVPALVGGL